MKKYPDTDFDLKTIKNGGFELIEIKEGWLNKRNILNIPHRHTFHEIVWITKGSDFHMVDFKDYNLSEGQILCIPKNSIHDFKPSKVTRGWKMIFDESFFTINQQQILKEFRIFIPGLRHKAFYLNTEETKIISSIFMLLKTVSGLQQRQALMLNLLIFVEDCYLSRAEKLDSEFVDFLKLLNKNIYKHKEISYYSNQLGISGKKLNLIIKNSTGKTTQDYIHSRLINEAKSKLRYSKQSVKEIAFSLGFKDALYFSRFFKHKTNNSPEAFRKRPS